MPFVAISGGNNAVEVMFEEKLPTARIIAPATAQAGNTIQVGWTGPALEGDYIGVGKPDATGAAKWDNYFSVSDGNPSALLMPTEPGDYLIRYFLGADRTMIAETQISLTPVTATIDAPAKAVVGADISVVWTGPAYSGDYIGIGKPDTTGAAKWENFFYVGVGSPQPLTIPTDVGEYEISYFFGQDRSILTTQTITVTDVGATITAPTQAEAGSNISVGWTGPAYEGDYVGIGKTGASGAAQWENFFYLDTGSPATLTIPAEPGDYLIQYFLGQDRSVLATIPLIATDVGASLTLPTEALAGSTIKVGWSGPAFDGDYIGIGKVDASGAAQWGNFFYVSDNPDGGRLLVPMQPGDYLVQYFVGQDRSVLITEEITVMPFKVTLTAPDTAIAGSTIEVGFDGPNYEGDYIGIGLVGASGAAQWQGYAYTNAGMPAKILVPIAPGDYSIQYFAGQDRSVLQTLPISVTAVQAQIVAPSNAPAGSEIIVGWDGPGYDGDYLGIGLVGAEGSAQWQSYGYTTAGNPMTVLAPEVPGDYVIQYFTGQGRTSIAGRPLTLQ